MSCSVICPEAASSCKSPAVVDRVLPDNLKFPVSILDPVISDVFTPSVNIAPADKSMFNVLPAKFTAPVA